MDKKYQVFISSTYTDMKAERQAAVEAILDAGHIPAGMELFSASDKKQIEVIKGWIDRSDIFMLVLGGRYGSVDPESGKSYIHLEYEHAVQTGKPFFALYLTQEAISEKVKLLGTDAMEQNDTKKLNDFRALVKSKLCSEVDDLKDIRIHVPRAIRDLSASHKLEGWVRASEAPDLSPLMAQLKALQEENAVLKDREKKGVSQSVIQFREGFTEESLDAPLQLAFDGRASTLVSQTVRQVWKGTYLKLFLMIAAKLLEEPVDVAMRAYVNKLILGQYTGFYRLSVTETDYQDMKMKLVGFGVISLKTKAEELRWALTDNGRAVMMKHHMGKKTA